MTREEAIYLLNNLRSVAEGKEDEAIDMSIERMVAEDDYCSYGERKGGDNE